MATVYATTADSWVRNTSSTSWADVQGDVDTVGTLHNNSQTSYAFGIYNIYTSGRGGAAWTIQRSYLPFDLSGESGTIDTVSLNVYMDNVGSTGIPSHVIAVEATALAGSTSDFGNVYTAGTTFGTAISSSVAASTTAGWHTFTIQPAGKTAIQNQIGSGTITIAIIGYAYDFGGSSPPLNSYYTKIEINYADGLRDPYLTINYATAVTDNATFFGANF